ncbi:helix-turn-helix transcriptional regulator [Acidaminobacter sp. JC074]|uniref:helix-turn-helix transcriptional regulator n=1 Tax=Acidaminobacter sp. JC074 TaxID=2530199 RepID=UPI001F0E8F40|nr:AraC family transcriptional regulator [Acidaminobacter sp. JC074]MCH4889244.1 helix-turn-helix transcriptional regulator [Acidaminobacter sp. JC074]
MKTRLKFLDKTTKKRSACADHFHIEFSCTLDRPGLLIEKGSSDYFVTNNVMTDAFFFSMELKHEFEWTIQVDGKERTVHSQVEDIWVNSPNSAFSHNNQHPAEFLVISIDAEIMFKHFMGYLPKDKLLFLNDYNIYDERLGYMMKILLLEAQWGSSGEGFIDNWLKLFSNYYINNYSNIQTLENHVTQSIISKQQILVINEYIEEHISESISIEELADLVSLGKFHFLNEFKKSTGMTPYQYLIDFKIEKAKKELVETNDTLVNIALSLGFSDSSHFTRTFKKHTHQTPKQYRQTKK